MAELGVCTSKDCRLPVQLQRAMAAEAEAAREARAKVILMLITDHLGDGHDDEQDDDDGKGGLNLILMVSPNSSDLQTSGDCCRWRTESCSGSQGSQVLPKKNIKLSFNDAGGV